jgi:hypothetical protein
MSESATVNEAPRKRRRRALRNPTPSVAVGSGSGIGALIVWVIGLSGTEVPPEMSAVVAGTIAWLVLLVGRRGIKPSIYAIWNGSGTPKD